MDKFPTGGAGDECPDDVRVSDIGKLGALLGKALYKFSKSLIWLLAAAPEVPGIPKVHVCALEIPYKDLD
jgi:hypothetical protein